MARRPLRIGALVSTPTGKARGRIGAFVQDSDARIYALLAWHVVAAEEPPAIYLGAEELGRAQAEDCATPDTRPVDPPFSEAMVAVPIDVADRPIILEEAGITVDNILDDPDRMLDLEVRTIADADGYARGKVVSVGNPVRVKNRLTGDVTRYLNAIEVHFDRIDPGVLVEGDAGMPIIDLAGALLGLLISAVEDRHFVAPVAPFLSDHGLTLYRHRPARPAAIDLDATGSQIRAGMRDIALNLSQWSSEVKREQREFEAAGYGRDLVEDDA